MCSRDTEMPVSFLDCFFFSLFFVYYSFPLLVGCRQGKLGSHAPAPLLTARKSTRASSSLCSQPASAAFYFIRECHTLTQSWMLWEWLFHSAGPSLLSPCQGAALLQPVLARHFCGAHLCFGVTCACFPTMSSAAVGKWPHMQWPVLDELLAHSEVLSILGDHQPAFVQGRKLHHCAWSKNKDTAFWQ